MPAKPKTTLKRALQEERQRVGSQVYPGDLAGDVLDARATTRWFGAPAIGLAIIALGLTAGLALLTPGNAPSDEPEHRMADQPPAPLPTPEPDTPALVQAPTPPPLPPEAVEPMNAPPSVASIKPKPPEIDRSLLPIARNKHTTWLASPAAHHRVIERQSRLAAQAAPPKRVRITISPPTRASMNELLKRTRNLKTQRT